MDEETHYGNILLAKFMGGVEEGNYPGSIILKFGIGVPAPDERHVYHSSRCLKYHESWDWFMKVLKKINDKYPEPEKESLGWYAYWGLEAILHEADLAGSFKHMVQLVEWYEQNK